MNNALTSPYFLFALLGLAFLTACPSEETTSETGLIWPVPTEAKDKDTLARILNILEETPDCTQQENATNPNCELIEIGFKAKVGKPKSAKQRVLVIDTGMYTESFTTYRSRVLDFLDLSEDGTLQTTKTRLTWRRGAERILGLEIGEGNPSFSLQYLQPYTSQISDSLLSGTNWLLAGGHGSGTLSTIAELSPDAEFVVMPVLEATGNAKYQRELCLFEKDPLALTRLESIYQMWAETVKEQVQKHNISFINMSFGETHATIRSDYSNLCGEQEAISQQAIESILRAGLEYFYRPISSLDGVVVVQSGVNNVYDRELQEGDSDFLVDCTPLPNRIRIGVATTGSGGEEFEIESSHRNTLGCIDAVFSVGPGYLKHYGYGLPAEDWNCALFGFNLTPCEGSTSLAAPIATAHLLWRAEQGEAGLALEAGKRSAQIFDPIGKKQFLRGL